MDLSTPLPVLSLTLRWLCCGVVSGSQNSDQKIRPTAMADSECADEDLFAQYLNYSDPGEADNKHIARSSPEPHHRSGVSEDAFSLTVPYPSEFVETFELMVQHVCNNDAFITLILLDQCSLEFGV